MKTGYYFIQRMREDAEFRRKVQAFDKVEERLAFIKSEGYDFSPFVEILNNLSASRKPVGWVARSSGKAIPGEWVYNFLGFINRIFRPLFNPHIDQPSSRR